MKTMTCVASLALLGLVSLFSNRVAAETRELDCPADQVFPKRKCVVPYENGVPHGQCKAFDDQGRLILTEDYVNGKVHGQRVCYYPSGKKFSEMKFVDGLAEGTTTSWYENGNVRMTDEMHLGLPHGVQTSFFSNGNKSSETPHVNAVTHGTCKHYLPDGRLFGLSTFEDGVETGKQIIIEPTASEYLTIVEDSKFSPFLPDHWPSTQRATTKKLEDLRAGDQAEVEWKGTWYPATIVRIEKRGYYIHYTGFDDSWDEYVWKNRIRPNAN
jgi:hypothetical protein